MLLLLAKGQGDKGTLFSEHLIVSKILLVISISNLTPKLTFPNWTNFISEYVFLVEPKEKELPYFLFIKSDKSEP